MAAASLRIDDLPSPSLIALAQSIHAACLSSPLSSLIPLLSSASELLASPELEGVQVPWCDLQDGDGFTALHCAAEGGRLDVVEYVVREGKAHWEITDNLGNTAGDMAFSLNYTEIYDFLLQEAFRSSILQSLLSPPSPSRSVDSDGDSVVRDADEPSTTAKAEPKSSASDNPTFLKSRLKFVTSPAGQAVCLDAEGNGVMMGWETPLMELTARKLCLDHPDHVGGSTSSVTGSVEEVGGQDLTVLNVGFGLGIVDREFQKYRPARHVIVEPHPDVLEYLYDEWLPSLPPPPSSASTSEAPSTAATSTAGPRKSQRTSSKTKKLSPSERDRLLSQHNLLVFPGTWQAFLSLLNSSSSHAYPLSYSVVYWDTFSESYSDLKEFVNAVPDLLDGPEARFSFFHGLGATSRFLYDLYTLLVEYDLREVGLGTEWEEVEVDEGGTERWEEVGVRRRYWNVPAKYRLAVCKMDV